MLADATNYMFVGFIPCAIPSASEIMGSAHCTSVGKNPRRTGEFFYQLVLVLPMKENVRDAVVIVVDDDASLRAALKELLTSVGLEVTLYASAGAFLEAPIPDITSCLVLDVRLPGMSGIKVQEKLSRTGIYVPIVFVTAHGDVAMAVRAMKAGAIDFLTKPFRSQDL